MTPEVRCGRLAKLFGILRFAVLAAVTIPASLAAHAQAFTLPPQEKVPTFLGIDLPLRPGERLLPLGNSGCSMVVFEPKPEQFEALRRLWEKWEWSGACRFGLIHGNGQISDLSLFHQEIWAIYGRQYLPARYETAYGSVHAAYSGSAFSALDTKQMSLFGSGDLENLDRFEKTSGNSFSIGLQSFDAAGNALNVGVWGGNDPYACVAANKDKYKPFQKEVKKVCSRNEAAQFFVSRSEGASGLMSGKYFWLKACPLKKGTGEVDCPALMREAIGKHYGEFETILAGSPAARPGMIQEILNRYAPLEAAVEARLKDKVSVGGAQ
jgi:hypothetical protein